MMDFFALKVNDPRLKASLDYIYQYSSDVMYNLVDIYFTDHSIRHLERVLKIVDSLLVQNEKEKFLSELETYILIASALLHDIGMQSEKKASDPNERRQLHHKIAAEIIRNSWKRIGIEEDLADTIALVVEGHRGELDKRFNERTVRTCETVRCDLLATLLYLCDELDISQERVDVKKIEYLNYKAESAFHFYKHYYTQGITIGDNCCLRVSFRYPVERKEQYHQIFGSHVLNKLEKVLKNTTPILQDKYKIILALRTEDVSIEENQSLEAINPNLFEQIHAESVGVKNFVFLQRIRFTDMIGDIDQELFYKGGVRWEDIVNNLDIKREQYNHVSLKLKELHQFSYSNRAVTGLLICGEGGSGKTTTLMRLAFEACKDADFTDSNLLWLPVDAEFDFRELQQLYFATQKPAIVFIDGINIETVADSILNQMSEVYAKQVPVIIVIAARLNEWINAGADGIKFQQFDRIQLNTLVDSEISNLLAKLDQYGQLYELTNLSPDERFQKLKAKSDGQLLVAMLEATRGKRFSEIVYDEYKNIKKTFPEAAKAYELISLFFVYDVLVPRELLFTLVQCVDEGDFEERVLAHTHLIIVRQPVTKYGILYRPRHREVARILLDNLPEYSTGGKRLKRMTIVLRSIDPLDRQQRYAILNFLNNYVASIIKTLPKSEYIDRLDEVRNFIYQNRLRIARLYDAAYQNKFIAELVVWGKLFRELRMWSEEIIILEKVVSLDQYDRRANYRLAKCLSHTRVVSENPEQIANYYRNSFIGQNRQVKFLYDYMEFCLKHKLFDHLDSVIESFDNFVSYSSEEEEIREKLAALITGYKLTKDRAVLSGRMSELAAHIGTTKELKSADQLAYIDLVESKDIKQMLTDYEEYLIAIAPNRPMGVLLRIAHTAAKIGGEEMKAITYYAEIYDRFIKSTLDPQHFDVLQEYAIFAARKNLQKKELNYSLFQKCKNMKPTVLETYVEFGQYAYRNGDVKTAHSIARDGIEMAKRTGRYDSWQRKNLSNLLDKLPLENMTTESTELKSSKKLL